MAGPNVRTRQVLSVVNACQQSIGHPNNGDPAGNQALTKCDADFELIEFTKEKVEVLLNEKMKGKNKFDYKGKSEQMQAYIKKLRLCVRWFQEQEEKYLLQLEKLQKMMESAESRRAETEAQMNTKVEELNRTVAELRRENASLQVKVSKEEADRLAAMNSLKQEMEARVAIEKLRISLSDELEKAHEDRLRSSEQIKLLQDTNKRLQEYNTSLQQYSSKLQNDNATARESISRVENEKNAMKETLSSIRSHSVSLKEQLAVSKVSREDALKQTEQLMKEVGCLTAELQQVREDRDLHISLEKGLRLEITIFAEVTGKSSVELDHLTAMANSLEETCSYKKDQIRILQQQLSAVNDKLQMVDLTSMGMISQCEEQKKVLLHLENCLIDAENQIVEGDLLRKKLHSMILELKENIRVFCRGAASMLRL